MQREDVERILQENQFEFGWYPKEQVIRAINRDDSSAKPVSAHQQLVIEFDESGAVRNITNKQIFTGP